MSRAFAKSFVLLALMLAGEARPTGEKETLRRGNLGAADSSFGNSDSSPDSKEDFTPFATNICLYVSPNLPACNFHRNERSADNAGDPRTYTKDSFDSINANDRLHSVDLKLTSKNDINSFAASNAGGEFTVYKIEGCLPSRLPFNIPFCNDVDSIGKIIDVRRLYPFPAGHSAKSPYVFPEFDIDTWKRTTNRIRTDRQFTTHHGVDSNKDGANDMTSNAITANKYVSKESPDGRVIGHPEKETTVNISSEKNIEETGRNREKRETLSLHETFKDPNTRGNTKRTMQVIPSHGWNSNAFANTIFLEPSQNLESIDELEAWNRASEPITSGTSARDLGSDESLNVLSNEFERRSIGRVRRQSKLNNEISQRESESADQFKEPLYVDRKPESLSRKSRNIKVGSEFPYWKAIPYDPKKLMLAGISTSFEEYRSRKTRDTLHNAARKSSGKFESRYDAGSDKVRSGERGSDKAASGTDSFSHAPHKTYLKESRDKVKRSGTKVRMTRRKGGSSTLAASYPRRRNSKNGRRSKRQ